MTYLLAAVWGAVGWRLRGGAFHDLTGIDVGDLPTRAVAGLWMTGPALLTSHSHAVPWASASLFLALCATSWGGFMALGRSPREDRRAVWTDALEAAGLDRGTLWYDVAGLAINGLIVTGSVAIFAAYASGVLVGLGVLAVGLLMPLCYWLGYHIPPVGRSVDTRTVWGEVLFGAVLSPAILWGF